MHGANGNTSMWSTLTITTSRWNDLSNTTTLKSWCDTVANRHKCQVINDQPVVKIKTGGSYNIDCPKGFGLLDKDIDEIYKW